ncbi:MAG: ABC transporter ATP-binding protein [Alphaproteobacteria bacterium]|jgi:branched-chain amino acid transport system ATP-binding protein|nr:ABC transporter ATP-binding protein [Rhodospirillaceae bacterium]MDP6406959.1 ABC transporter ATP-binding protein [Alphaproteobacteria bacterium]MDP6621703.1 ABC transporter ATP-binding protein [Alphaproteobacteria bacterium]|tara:strand:+ start:1846 stop:2595 length:750 start_codon:yes stop_codon:yes gene_type:complete
MTAVIELNGVHKDFSGSQIIRGVDWTITEGERHALIGPNGAGKSTLYNLISGKYPISAGSIKLKGREIAGLPPYAINRMGLSRSFQVTNIFHRMTVYENVRCGVLWSMGHKYSLLQPVEDLEDVNLRTDEILEQIGMAERAAVPAGILTYAEQRALEIAITIAGGADIILLDEPTSGMSHSETEQTVELVRRITEGKTLVVVEHDMGVVFDLADRISVLVYGEIIATDTPEKIRSNQAVQEAYLGTEET